MGVKILDEDGALLHEFAPNLGKPLLFKLLAVAKFTGEDEEIIILNKHVADLGTALTKSGKSAGIETFSHDVRVRLSNSLRHSILSGRTPWRSMTPEQKSDLVLNTLFAPSGASDDFLASFIDDVDAYVERVRQALDQP